MMTGGDTGTVLITGPTSGLGRALALEVAGRPETDRPDLLLVGRPGERLTPCTAAPAARGAARSAGEGDSHRPGAHARRPFPYVCHAAPRAPGRADL